MKPMGKDTLLVDRIDATAVCAVTDKREESGAVDRHERQEAAQ